jgi:F-type H+-transporting ATPase subunit a
MIIDTLRLKGLSKSIAFVLATVFLSFTAFAQHEEDHKQEDGIDKIIEDLGHEQESEGFNASEMIMHHVSDAHEIHFMGEGESSIAIYLPIILKTNDGWDFFSSSHFYHNPVEIEEHGEKVEYYKYKDYILFHEHIYYANEEGGLTLEHGHALNAAPFDISITKNVAGVFIAIFLLYLILRATVKGYQKNEGHAPKGIQSFMEPLILFVKDDVILSSFGGDKERAAKFTPFLLTTFFFIWISNMLGLVPFLGGFNITGTLAITLVLAAFVFIITTFKGNKHYWGHILWPAGVPGFVKIILVPIEIASIFIKPTVLMVRLTANIMAGHIIILAFVSLILIFGYQSASVGYGVGVGSTIFMIFMYFIELLVAFLQAYVFTLLASIYFGDATQKAHH